MGMKLESDKVTTENAVQADLTKKEKVQKQVLKVTAALENSKAEARRLAMQNQLQKAYKKKDPAATQNLLIKFAGKAKEAADDLGEIKRKEGEAFKKVKSLQMAITKQGNVIRSIKHSMNPQPVRLKIASLRARLAKESKALATVKTKEIDAKDELSARNVKYEMVDEHEKGAVSKLQHGFVVQARKRRKVEQAESKLHKGLAKANGVLRYASKEKIKHQRQLKRMTAALKKAQAATAKERKAKAGVSSNGALNATLVAKLAGFRKALKNSQHEKALNGVKLKVATLAVKSKKLAMAAAKGDRKVGL